MRRDRLLIAASFAAIVCAVPAAADAQEAGPIASHDSVSFVPVLDTMTVPIERDVTSPTPKAVPNSVSRDALRAGVRAPVTATMAGPSIARNSAGLGPARAMMAVGGAAIIVGAIIGDTPGTLFMVGGAIVGLYGLYQYLQ